MSCSEPQSWVNFDAWWNMPVLRAMVEPMEDKPRDRPMLTRKEVVLHVADTDGGAHVDSGLDSIYVSMSRSNAVGLAVSTRALPPVPLGDPVPPTLRQIAFEVLKTAERHAQTWE